MIKKIYSILDKKAVVYNTPFFQISDVFAEREVMVAMQNNDISLTLFPEDYDLVCLGTYDDSNAKMSLETFPKHVCSCMAFKARLKTILDNHAKKADNTNKDTNKPAETKNESSN